ncbi:hypothetical protein NG42_21540 [Winslowiella iniecta]|uniref:Uncharacterized protein n=1 Tax=Winslowiella iniecta TaxID=1560201 RepID=A0A0L7SUW2_9GAMM|nr:hypothetical protein NG42_21540 [Winslowiella iniecta]KOC87328.1 hypothetical protein NG43_21500 [Winslowiella iniecta]
MLYPINKLSRSVFDKTHYPSIAFIMRKQISQPAIKHLSCKIKESQATALMNITKAQILSKRSMTTASVATTGS